MQNKPTGNAANAARLLDHLKTGSSHTADDDEHGGGCEGEEDDGVEDAAGAAAKQVRMI